MNVAHKPPHRDQKPTGVVHRLTTLKTLPENQELPQQPGRSQRRRDAPSLLAQRGSWVCLRLTSRLFTGSPTTFESRQAVWVPSPFGRLSGRRPARGISPDFFEAGRVGFWSGVAVPRSRDVPLACWRVGAALGSHRKCVRWSPLRHAAHASPFGLVVPVVAR